MCDEEDQEPATLYPLKLFCADVSWISKFSNEMEYLMPPTFLDTKKTEIDKTNKTRDGKMRCYVIETDTFKRVQR